MFREIPASKRSLMKRRPVCGVGINDADYHVVATIDGKKSLCRFYIVWAAMLKREFDREFLKTNPTYQGCTIAKEWLTFSNFKAWMEKQDWKNKQIDKDILILGNKHYSPETCTFVSHQINSIFGDHGAARGLYPQGVSYHKERKKYVAQISRFGKHKLLGRFDSVNAAARCYAKAKAEYIETVALMQDNNKIKEGLMAHAGIWREAT